MNPRNGTATLILLILVVSSVGAAETPPFVAGFDRFARHGEIDEITAGRLLLSELSCTACHATTDQTLKAKRGPRLIGAGNRLQRDWLIRFLSAPSAVKPGTTMPDVLASLSEERRAEAIQALAAYLGSLTQPFPEIKGTGARPVPGRFWSHGDRSTGQALFHRTGCVACHEADAGWETAETKPSPLDAMLEQLDPEELEEAGLLAAARRVPSVPLGNPAVKYSPQSLTYFLIDPHRVRPHGRMPDFQLSVVEAADIAAWLLREAPKNIQLLDSAERVTPELIRQGQQLFVELGCAGCHDVNDTTSSAPAKALSELDPGSERQCVGAVAPGMPHFVVDELQRTAIHAALEAAGSSTSESAEETVDLTLLRMNCLGCHERDGRGGVGRYRKAYFETVGYVDIGDEGRLPPPLSGVGRRLKQDWLTRVLQGKGRTRLHMRARMPVFRNQETGALPARLAAADRPESPPSEQDVFGDLSDLAEPGRQLLDTGCVQCHPLRGESVPGVLGVDLEGVASRVQPQWFHDFVFNPGDLKPHTRMPSFFPRGQSQNPAVLEGDVERQIAAMWTYLKGLSRHQLPDRIEQARSQDYELKPEDRPILLRTFMEQAGTHAIAVGHPQRVHFAFDAEQLRLAQLWRGRFIDAQGTWFVRFAPPARPLGTDVVSLPVGPLLAEATDPGAPWPESADLSRPGVTGFRGYRVDSDGVPVFLYRIASIDVEDRIVPEGEQLVRRLSLTRRSAADPEQPVWLRVHAGRQLEMVSDQLCRSDAGLQVSIDSSVDLPAQLRTLENGMDWVMSLPQVESLTIEVRYQW